MAAFDRRMPNPARRMPDVKRMRFPPHYLDLYPVKGFLRFRRNCARNRPVAFGNWIAKTIRRERRKTMMVAAGLGGLVVICLLFAMMDTPPHIGR
jgi:hypothetical protein